MAYKRFEPGLNEHTTQIRFILIDVLLHCIRDELWLSAVSPKIWKSFQAIHIEICLLLLVQGIYYWNITHWAWTQYLLLHRSSIQLFQKSYHRIYYKSSCNHATHPLGWIIHLKSNNFADPENKYPPPSLLLVPFSYLAPGEASVWVLQNYSNHTTLVRRYNY